MRVFKFIGFLLLFSLFAFQNLNAQTQKKTRTTKKQAATIKTVPAATKNKTALKIATKKVSTARKQQIKKAVRRSKLARRPIRRR